MFSTRCIFGTAFLSAGLGLLASLWLPSHLMAQTGEGPTSIDNICLAEARRAEERHGIPAGLMRSITRVESGRKMVTGEYMPWAWTLNDRGEGLFFDDRESALAYLRDAMASPDHSVDVGCMQVNTKWHADGFLDIADMLDPVHNASYAAGFLLDLHAAHQSWDEAVKHYHSADPDKNVAYHRRVLAELERFMADAESAFPPSDDLVVESALVNPAATTDPDTVPSVPEVGSTDLALIARAPSNLPEMITSPSDAESSQPDAPASVTAPPVAAPSSVAAPRTDMPLPTVNEDGDGAPGMAEDPLLAKQPNLAPHRSRVEHFRRLLARQSG